MNKNRKLLVVASVIFAFQNRMKTFMPIVISVILISLLFPLAGYSSSVKSRDKIPTFRVGYIFSDHSLLSIAAAHKAEAFKGQGPYLETVINNEVYRLISKNGDQVANIEMIVTNSGAEAATMLSQKQLDISMFSVTVVMSNRDRDVPIKVLGPAHLGGNSLVFHKDTGVKDWDTFYNYIQQSTTPVSIGYISPTSSATIIIKSALAKNGISYTEDFENSEADVLLVNLRSTANFMTAMSSGQVVGWIGPSPFPMVAEHQGIGNIVFESSEFPPLDYFVDFPCCCLVASEHIIENYPNEMQIFVDLMRFTADFLNNNRDEAATIVSERIGVPKEAAKLSTVHYTVVPTESWMRGTEVLYNFLNGTGHFNGKMQNLDFEEVKSEIFDFRFTNH
ncbi:ABC transporter substrate-binding protein [Desulfonatronum sp. SC1]|uniref:ABC transporter substrate-binding protein n=1 Tax=Desulfonatronum sp. SC1 TaxID=2109626 RepID=UPI000D321513|nr:ABC transporter substrate-binding protein [Desulfonatronum sp. SC1]PTN32241.1 ABC transporter substrate-binding protein [Desulfonatronum sp. SC1]